MEDILSTYCVDSNQGGPGEDGAQGEPAEPEDAEKSRTYVARNGEPEGVCQLCVASGQGVELWGLPRFWT